MFTIRKSDERGHFNHGWLETRHTFSFDQYRDPRYMRFRDLRVINQDIVKAGEGFGAHQHNDMEILTYVLRGAVTHQDSMGNKGIIKPGEIQRMSAGTGVTHSEFNNENEDLELLQIWIFPEKKDLPPSYEQVKYTTPHNQLILIATSNPEKNAVLIHQDVKIYTGQLDAHQSLNYELKQNRYAWLQLISGELTIDQNTLLAGDGVAISQEEKIIIKANTASTFLLFDLK